MTDSTTSKRAINITLGLVSYALSHTAYAIQCPEQFDGLSRDAALQQMRQLRPLLEQNTRTASQTRNCPVVIQGKLFLGRPLCFMAGLPVSKAIIFSKREDQQLSHIQYFVDYSAERQQRLQTYLGNKQQRIQHPIEKLKPSSDKQAVFFSNETQYLRLDDPIDDRGVKRNIITIVEKQNADIAFMEPGNCNRER